MQVAPGIRDADAIILSKALEQVDSLVQHQIPGIPARVVVKRQMAVAGPLLEWRVIAVFAAEERAPTAASNARPKSMPALVSFLPAIDIPVLVPPWRTQ